MYFHPALVDFYLGYYFFDLDFDLAFADLVFVYFPAAVAVVLSAAVFLMQRIDCAAFPDLPV